MGECLSSLGATRPAGRRCLLGQVCGGRGFFHTLLVQNRHVWGPSAVISVHDGGACASTPPTKPLPARIALAALGLSGAPPGSRPTFTCMRTMRALWAPRGQLHHTIDDNLNQNLIFSSTGAQQVLMRSSPSHLPMREGNPRASRSSRARSPPGSRCARRASRRRDGAHRVLIASSIWSCSCASRARARREWSSGAARCCIVARLCEAASHVRARTCTRSGRARRARGAKARCRAVS